MTCATFWTICPEPYPRSPLTLTLSQRARGPGDQARPGYTSPYQLSRREREKRPDHLVTALKLE